MASSMRDAADKATWSQMASGGWRTPNITRTADQRSARGPRPATEGHSRWAQISTSDLAH
jgi:hypothetical protein